MADRKIRYTDDGIPLDINDWTYEDWKALHFGMQAIRKMIAENHRGEREKQKKAEVKS